ncbi:MAG: hypothetical protein LBD58_10860 [Treponema sp.]|nr:hypothetical protein [Treponema sp.]
MKSAPPTNWPRTLELPPEAEGTALSGAMAWRNEKGREGPWSEIQPAVIP